MTTRRRRNKLPAALTFGPRTEPQEQKSKEQEPQEQKPARTATFSKKRNLRTLPTTEIFLIIFAWPMISYDGKVAAAAVVPTVMEAASQKGRR